MLSHVPQITHARLVRGQLAGRSREATDHPHHEAKTVGTAELYMNEEFSLHRGYTDESAKQRFSCLDLFWWICKRRLNITLSFSCTAVSVVPALGQHGFPAIQMFRLLIEDTVYYQKNWWSSVNSCCILSFYWNLQINRIEWSRFSSS